MTTRTLFLLSAAVLFLPALAIGQAGDTEAETDTEIERVDLGASAENVDAQRELWTERFRAARDAVAEARLRNTLAQDAYREMRHRRNQTGDEKAQVMAEITDSEVALTGAETTLKDLFEAARKAGVPPGWMRMARSEVPASDAPAEEP